MFDTLIQYGSLTGDTQYNGIASQALLAQQGPNGDFMPPNQTKSEGNDDQSIWALAALSAAEAQLAAPAASSWVSFAENVFNEQIARWDSKTCGGGLRWQILVFNNGYDYKNTASNGLFFELASRLAQYTGNDTYSTWASTAFKWSQNIGFVDEKWDVFDGAQVSTNCSDINKLQESLYAGAYISGAAYMYNTTGGDSDWKDALDGLLNRTLSVFFPDGILTEIACEAQGTCSTDMRAFKGLLAQRLVKTIQVAPYTFPTIQPLLLSSAQAAAKACSETTCQLSWNGKQSGDGQGGVGEQLDALSVVQALLAQDATPVTKQQEGNNATVPASGTSSASGTQAGASSGTPTASPQGTSAATKLGGLGISTFMALSISLALLIN